MQAAPTAAPTPAPTFTPASGPQSVPELNELEDLLYDLLATGSADANVPGGALDAAQAFLHEHARARKSHAEFVAFFTQHNFPMRPERPNLLALPALDARGRASEAPVLVPAHAPESALQLMAAAAHGAETARAPRPTRSWAWVLVIAAVSGIIAVATATVLELRSELSRLHDESVQTAATLEQLRLETQSLHAQLKDASQSVQQNVRDTQELLHAFGSPLRANSW